MKNSRSYRRFQPLQQEISALKKNNSRFKTVFREYEMISDELWSLENSKETDVSDDFLNAMQQQSLFLEVEIDEWLSNSAKSEDTPPA